MIRHIRLCIAYCLCFCLILSDCAESEAKAYIVMDYDTGHVLYEKNADERYAIASTTKIMTCLLALENADLADMVTAGKNASGVPGTSIYLSEGESLTMEDMLYGLMLRSGNDAAVAIAEHISGNVKAFSELMNARAEELGADAYFTTPNGLDEGGNGASARGIVLISKEAMKKEAFRKIVSTKKRTIPWKDREYERVLTNKNKLLSAYEGATGIKTGFTSKAGRCLVFSAERENMTLIGCVLNCPDWFDEAEKLLDKGFEEYDMKVFYPKGETVRTIQAYGDEVRISAKEDIKAPVMDGEEVQVILEIRDIRLPVKKGEAAGWARVVVQGRERAEYELVYQSSIEKRTFSNALKTVISNWTLL